MFTNSRFGLLWFLKLVWLSPWAAFRFLLLLLVLLLLLLLLLHDHLHQNLLLFCFSLWWILISVVFSWWWVLTLVCTLTWSNFTLASFGLCQHLSLIGRRTLISVQFLLCWNWLNVSLSEILIYPPLRRALLRLVHLDRDQTTLSHLPGWASIGSWYIWVLAGFAHLKYFLSSTSFSSFFPFYRVQGLYYGIL